jgi:hypothetical protein
VITGIYRASGYATVLGNLAGMPGVECTGTTVGQQAYTF